jgi:hypothetical protein
MEQAVDPTHSGGSSAICLEVFGLYMPFEKFPIDTGWRILLPMNPLPFDRYYKWWNSKKLPQLQSKVNLYIYNIGMRRREKLPSLYIVTYNNYTAGRHTAKR